VSIGHFGCPADILQGSATAAIKISALGILLGSTILKEINRLHLKRAASRECRAAYCSFYLFFASPALAIVRL